MLKQMIEFVKAYETHASMQRFPYRESSAKRLADAYEALPAEVCEGIHFSETARSAMHSVQSVIHSLPAGEARDLVARAIDPLRVAYADSIVTLNAEPGAAAATEVAQ